MIHMENIVKAYTLGGETIYALDHVSLDVAEGEYVAITGPSGSGKSTLMNIIGCLDVADSGTYILNDKKIEKYSNRQLARLRNTHIGFIFQGFNLLQKLNALENVELPLIYQKIPPSKRKARALNSLQAVGLKDRAGHRPSELSGGQQQRCAIARALVTDPKLILADEPTGNLDSKTGLEILSLFDRLHAEGNTIVLITHDAGVAARAQRVVHIVDGKIWEGAPVTDTLDHVDHIMTPDTGSAAATCEKAPETPEATPETRKDAAPEEGAGETEDDAPQTAPAAPAHPARETDTENVPVSSAVSFGKAETEPAPAVSAAPAAAILPAEITWDGEDIPLDDETVRRYADHDGAKEGKA